MKTKLVFLCCAVHFAALCQNSPYALKSMDNTTTYGSYEIDNGGHFIRERQGVLNFLFSDADYIVEFNSDPSIITNGSRLTWTPRRDQDTGTITVAIKKRSDNTYVDRNVPLKLPVKPNTGPKAIYSNTITFTKTKGKELVINLNEYVVDEDNDALIYRWVLTPTNFPPLVGSTITLPSNFNSAKPIDIGVVGVSDNPAHYTELVVKVEHAVTPVAPVFKPDPNVEGVIAYEKDVKEGDQIDFYLRAISNIDNRDVPITLIGEAGLGNTVTYLNGRLSGTISYDALPDDLSDEQIDTYFTKKVKFSATNVVGTSDVTLLFRVKSNASPEKILAYKEKRQAVLTKNEEYRELAMAKWAIIYADLQKVKKKEAALAAIDGGLQGLGGMSAISANVPFATIVAGLSIVKGQVSNVLKDREKGILTNIETLTKAISSIKDPIDSFVTTYSETPKQTAYNTRAMNEMETKKLIVTNGASDFRIAIVGINTIFPPRN